MIVYKITNRVNGKVYVGKTVASVGARWNRHCWESTLAESPMPISRAIRKYGTSSFEIEVLYRAKTTDELSKMETFFIILHQSHLKVNGYNLTLGGDGAPIGNIYMLGKKLSLEARQKIQKSKEGKHFPNLSAAKKGCIVRHSEATRLKMGNTRRGKKLGRPLTEEHRKNISVAKLGTSSWNTGMELSDTHRQHLKDAWIRRKAVACGN